MTGSSRAAGADSGTHPIPSPTIIPRSAHPISRQHITDGALKVLYRLNDAGFEAYLVGGGVRDLMLGREPKDFDLATDAHPEEIKALFRNCRLIGRRFRLAHVRFGREVIEVATFRAGHDAEPDGGGRERNVDGRIIFDNVYGNREQDALRRDFSVNCLYYDVRDFSVIDYAGGVADLEQGLIRIIGDPETRYREDPVRLLRALRFAAKLGFRIEPATEALIGPLGHLLEGIPPARLFEEVLKLFLGGAAAATFELLCRYDIFRYLFPRTDDCLARANDAYPHTLLMKAMENTDARLAAGKPVTPGFLFAALLWEPLREEQSGYDGSDLPEAEAMQLAANDVILDQVERVSVPRRFSTMAREIWAMQPRLRHPSERRAARLMAHPRFRAAYDFLLLRAAAGEEVQDLAEWWTAVQGDAAGGSSETRDRGSGSRRPRRRRRRSASRTA